MLIALVLPRQIGPRQTSPCLGTPLDYGRLERFLCEHLEHVVTR